LSRADRATAAARRLRDEAGRLRFTAPVTHVYNPLRYAWAMNLRYLRRYGDGPKRVLLLGMNPGPWGMAQTGVPFGEVAAVRDWLRLEAPIEAPRRPHPRRPITGLACARSEVSGRRLWGLFAERFGTPAAFFADHLVVNYCPLVFLERSGRNRTPDRLPADEARPLLTACDRHLLRLVDIYEPHWCVGIGAYATRRLQTSLGGGGVELVQILHPSPASPAANRGWAAAATRQLVAAGVWSG
jgi:single-strand selective monofunctional uracil DNA glycosylase